MRNFRLQAADILPISGACKESRYQFGIITAVRTEGPVPEYKSIKMDESKAGGHRANVSGEIKPIRGKSFGCVNLHLFSVIFRLSAIE